MFLLSVYTFKICLHFLHAYIYSSLHSYQSLENDRSLVETSYFTVNFLPLKVLVKKINTLPWRKQICFTIVWGCAEILPSFLNAVVPGRFF